TRGWVPREPYAFGADRLPVVVHSRSGLGDVLVRTREACAGDGDDPPERPTAHGAVLRPAAARPPVGDLGREPAERTGSAGPLRRPSRGRGRRRPDHAIGRVRRCQRGRLTTPLAFRLP